MLYSKKVTYYFIPPLPLLRYKTEQSKRCALQADERRISRLLRRGIPAQRVAAQCRRGLGRGRTASHRYRNR